MKKSEGPDLKKQIFVVGAGASGLMAAIQAAINGAAVTVLEQNDRPGRKICATGNGRCNMTNLNHVLFVLEAQDVVLQPFVTRGSS